MGCLRRDRRRADGEKRGAAGGRAGGVTGGGGAGGRCRERLPGGNGSWRGRGSRKRCAPGPPAIPRPFASRRRAPLAAVLVLSTALLAGYCAAAPHAGAGGHRLAAEISSGAASPTSLRAVPFGLEFSGAIDASTLDAADISVSSGTVRNLRLEPRHDAALGGEGAGGGRFKFPTGVAAGGPGLAYAADTYNHRVQAFDLDGAHVLTFGSEGGVDGQFRGPRGVAVDGSGRVYVADAGNHRVQVFNANGTHNVTIGSFGSGDDQFGYPNGVAVGGPGRVYVADSGNRRVQVFDAAYSFDVADPADGRMLTASMPAGRVQDRAGNANVESNAAGIGIDRTGPNATVTASHQGPTNASTIGFTVEFSENVTGFELGDVSLSGTAPGSVGNFAGGGASYYFDVSPLSDGTIRVGIPAGAARDAAGNANGASNTATVRADGTAPAVLSAAITGPHHATVRYSEPANATGPAYGMNTAGGAGRQAGALQGSGTDSHTVRFGGDPAARDATGTITIDLAAVADLAGNDLGAGTAVRELADGQAPLLASASLDLTAGHGGRLALEFDEATTMPDAWSFGGAVEIGGGGRTIALFAGDIPSVASGHTGDRAFALDVSGAKRVELNAADLGSARISLPGGFVRDLAGNPHAGNRPAVPLEYAQDHTPPRLAAAAFNLAPAGGGAGRLVLTFDEAAAIPDARSFPGSIEVRGSGAGNAAATLSAGDILSTESGRAGDRTFVLLVSDYKREALGAPEYADPLRATVALPDGFATNGRSAYEAEPAPLAVARDSAAPSFVRASVLNGSSVTAYYDEPVLAVPAHYSDIVADGIAAEGSRGAASGAAAYGRNVVVSWNGAPAASTVGFRVSGNVTDLFGNHLSNPGPKAAGGEGAGGGQRVQVGVFARGPGDPSAAAARLGAAEFNAVSEERGYPFFVDVSEYGAPAGRGAAAALRDAHDGGNGPALYVGPASDAALHDMAGYAAANNVAIVSHSSAARSLAVGGDGVYRLEPGAAHLARALAHTIARGGFDAVVPVVQADLYGSAVTGSPGFAHVLTPDAGPPAGAADGPAFAHGLLGPLAADLAPLGIPVGRPVEFTGGGGAGSAAAIGAAVMAAAGSGTGRSVAVVYAGSDSEFAAMAGNVGEGSPIRERSAWFAAGGAGAGTGSGVAASPLVIRDAAAARLAGDVRLSAVQFAVERNGMTDYIDDAAGAPGPAGSATPAYAAYEAVRALGRALALAGGDPLEARGRVAEAAALDGGPLGRTDMDGNGDLRLPVTYGVWSVSGTPAGWVRAPELLRGMDRCGMALEKSSLALPALAPGRASGSARQTVTNAGTVPMPAVSVSATDWALHGRGSAPGASLPFSLTEISIGSGGFAPLAAGAEIPGGTPAGGSVAVDFRLNLEGVPELDAHTVTQTVTYGVDC